MLQISEREIKARLQFDNPWWEDHQIEPRFAQMRRRHYFDSFFELVTDRSINRAIVLMGPRRVGKTVMVYHAVQKPHHILYLSLETPLYTDLRLDQLLKFFSELHKHTRQSDLMVFFDEVQYLKGWEVHLKSLVDSYPQYRFVVTGSAAAALRLKSQESGAGRFSDFLLPPLTFAEYLSFIDREDELITQRNGQHVTTNITELNQEFINYLNFGGYPEAVSSKTMQENSSRFIKSDIIDKVLLRDLPSLYGISDIQELNRLFTTLAYNTGNEVSLDNLSKSSGVAKNTLKRYIEYLEAAFLVRRIHRIDDSAKQFRRATSFKVYLTNPSMRAALFGYVDENSEAIGALTETAIFSQWFHSEDISQLHYARWKSGEVDLVALSKSNQKPRWCVEIKWSDRVVRDHQEIAGLIKFAKDHHFSHPQLVTTKTLTQQFTIQGIEIKFKPSAEQVYTLGKNIVLGLQKNNRQLTGTHQSMDLVEDNS
jgi:uncharacterized protein